MEESVEEKRQMVRLGLSPSNYKARSLHIYHQEVVLEGLGRR